MQEWSWILLRLITLLVLFCDILDAVKKSPYERDPRGTAKKAEEYLKSSGVGDKAFLWSRA